MKLSSIFFSPILVLALVSCQSGGSVKMKSHVKQQKLSNGIEVLRLRDESLPHFKIMLWLPQGYAYEYGEKQGLTQLMLQTLGSATQEKGKKEILTAFSQAGSSLNTTALDDQVLISAQSLSQDSDALSAIFSEVVLQAKFKEEDMKSQKVRMIAQLKSLSDRPSSLSGLAFQKAIFQDHGYARLAHGKISTLRSINLRDVKRRYEQILNPQKMKLVFIGKWSEQAEMDTLSAFSDLESLIGENEDLIRSIVPEGEAQSLFYSKRGLKQADVHLGLSSIPRSAEAYEALKVGLFVLGGGFKSRLNQRLRVEQGLTYGIGGGLDAQVDGGLISFSGAVRHDKLGPFVDGAKKILKQASQEGVTQDELDRVKNYIKGQFPKALETKEKEVVQYLDLESRGVEGKELYTYLDKVSKLSLSQVNDALRKYLYMPRLTVVVLGDKSKVSKKVLSGFQVKSAKVLQN